MTQRTPRRDTSARGQQRRDSILEASAELFAKQGFQKTTVRDIADSTGLLSGSLYYYFESKEDIADALLARLLAHLWPRYEKVVDSEVTPREKLAGIVRASLSGIDRYPNEVAIFQKEGPFLATTERFAYIAERNDQFRSMLMAILADGVAQKEFRGDLHVEVVFRLIRDSMWPIVGWYRPGGELTIDDVINDYLTVLFGGMAVLPVPAQTA
jgi:TetR/AcrR family transcriptional regulator, cholesterol catabolism regulator